MANMAAPQDAQEWNWRARATLSKHTNFDGSGHEEG